jgi:Aspartyl protease
MNIFRTLVQLTILVIFCSAKNALSSALPTDISLSKDAGRGSMIFVTVRLDDGEKLPFVLDTGSPATCLDQSLESKLGKRLQTKTLWAFGARSQIGVYPAPSLYLGKILLKKSGDFIVTHDCRQMSAAVGHPIMGILGMDILTNYCIQLDFDARKIRFLDYEDANKRRCGNSFLLTYLQDGCPRISDNVIGAPGVGSLIDTGCSYDGWLIPQLYQQWTDSTAPLIAGQARAPDGVLGGDLYSGLHLRCVDPKLLSTGDTHIQFNGLGLHFLARHLVTLDFPEQTLYLKRTSIDALDQKDINASTKLDIASAAKVLKGLEQDGRLPGWSKIDNMTASKGTFVLESRSITFNIQKSADPTTFHYKFTQSNHDGSWQLTRAWRTNPAGHIIQEYPVP